MTPTSFWIANLAISAKKMWPQMTDEQFDTAYEEFLAEKGSEARLSLSDVSVGLEKKLKQVLGTPLTPEQIKKREFKKSMEELIAYFGGKAVVMTMEVKK